MTHVKRLREAPQHLGLLLARIEPIIVAGKLGPLLWQLPPTFKRDDQRLAETLAGLPRTLRHAFEFRHPSWFAEPVMELLRAHRVALVIADRPEIHSFQSRELTTDFTFVRFHHGTRGRRGTIRARNSRPGRPRSATWSADHDVYAYFNNDWEGFAPANAIAPEAVRRCWLSGAFRAPRRWYGFAFRLSEISEAEPP